VQPSFFVYLQSNPKKKQADAHTVELANTCLSKSHFSMQEQQESY
jgi:hypothetical protein